jgi:hypothetical protein
MCPVNSAEVLTTTMYVKPFFRQMHQLMQTSANKYDTSLCTIHGICSVPITTKTQEIIQEEDEFDEESINGLSNFRGVRILPHNVGATDGFMDLLVWLMNNTSADKYTMVRADVNIYMRYYRVGCLFFYSWNFLFLSLFILGIC